MIRRLLLGVAAALLVAGVAGCGAIGSVVDTDTALHDAGYQSVKVSPRPNTNSVDVSVTVHAGPSANNARDVASVVWRTFHERFDYLTVTVHGTGPDLHQEYSFAQLVEAFGQRNPAWNRTSVKGGLTRIGEVIIVALVGLAGLVVVVVLLVQRRNRGRRPPWPPGGPGWPAAPHSGHPGPYVPPPSYPPYRPPEGPPGWGPPPAG